MRASLLLAALSLAGPAAAASFDCTEASRPDERAVCASPKLSALDGARASDARKAPGGADIGCLVAAHAGEGACARTRIAAIGGRLEGDGDFSTGTSVARAGGLRQVSYARVDAAGGARRGDPVLVCLTAIPKRCPPGDDRRRFDTATDLRTHRSWSLPDAQRRCGGA